MNKCPCGGKKPFKQCCGRFLDQGLRPKTPEQLMRSRYSAYALGNYGQYLFDTWFPVTIGELSVEELSSSSTEWLGLEVVSKSQKGDDGTVEFRARYREAGNTDIAEMYELSTFKRVKGRWLYVGAEVLEK